MASPHPPDVEEIGQENYRDHKAMTTPNEVFGSLVEIVQADAEQGTKLLKMIQNYTAGLMALSPRAAMDLSPGDDIETQRQSRRIDEVKTDDGVWNPDEAPLSAMNPTMLSSQAFPRMETDQTAGAAWDISRKSAPTQLTSMMTDMTELDDDTSSDEAEIIHDGNSGARISALE